MNEVLSAIKTIPFTPIIKDKITLGMGQYILSEIATSGVFSF